MQSYQRHWAACGSRRGRGATVSPGNGQMKNLSRGTCLDRLSAQPRNYWSNLIWLRKFISVKETIAVGSSWIAARIIAAVGVTCVIAVTARKFADTENVTSISRELQIRANLTGANREDRKREE